MKRVLAVILTLCLLLGAFPSFAEVDYASDYEAALKLAYNDLSNVQNVQEAIDMLKRLGSYMLSRGYVQYLGALADLAGEDPDMEKDILSISILAEAPTFVTDLEERGLPSCEELLQYMQARVLEQQADFAGAYDLYKTLMILDAPDRAIGLRMTINSTDSLVTVISRDENGSVLERRTEAISKGGEKTFTAKEFDGYELTPGSLRSVKVTVDSLGRQSHKEVVFVYRKLPDTVPVAVVYRTDVGKELARETVNVERGGSMTVEAKTFDGFDLVSGAAKKVQVFADNTGKLSQAEVVFTYRALLAYAKVAVVCQDEDGKQLRTETVLIDRGSSKTIMAASLDGYELTGTSSVKVTVDSKGKADKNRVVFKYKKIKPKVAAGDYVTFGHYPQTAAGNDNTPIEWLVLDVQDGRALLISRYALDVQPYNREDTDVSWEKCTLRTWLNETFLKKAFTAQEQGTILLTNVDNSASQGYSGFDPSGGNNTQDKIFLLSFAEANHYFGVQFETGFVAEPGKFLNKKSRVAPTAYAKSNGAKPNDIYKTLDCQFEFAVSWWLRISFPVKGRQKAEHVCSDGSLDCWYVIEDRLCVRPAIWIDLNCYIY